MEIPIKAIEVIAASVIVVLQFVQNPSQYRWYVIGLVAVVVACSVAVQVLEGKRRKKWEDGQVERDQKLIAIVLAKAGKLTEVPAQPSVPTPSVMPTMEVSPRDPRVYADSIKETQDSIFPQTFFVLVNRGGDVAHKVKLEMLFKLRGRNVSFPDVEALPVNEPREVEPSIGEESLSRKHDVFHWLLEDWNANAGGLVEEWPKEMNLRWQNYRGEKFVCALTLVFYPIDYMLRRNKNWPTADFRVSEFKNMRFSRE